MPAQELSINIGHAGLCCSVFSSLTFLHMAHTALMFKYEESPDPIPRPTTGRSTRPERFQASSDAQTTSDTHESCPPWLYFDQTWEPDDLELCLRSPRQWALARPYQYPQIHRLHQHLMRLAVEKGDTGPDGVDFKKLGPGISNQELAMIFACRTCGLNPVEYWDAVYSPECNKYIEHARKQEAEWWRETEQKHARGEFRLDPETWLRMGWVVRVAFRERFDAMVAGVRAFGEARDRSMPKWSRRC